MINFRTGSCRIVTASVIAIEENRSKREESPSFPPIIVPGRQLWPSKSCGGHGWKPAYRNYRIPLSPDIYTPINRAPSFVRALETTFYRPLWSPKNAFR